MTTTRWAPADAERGEELDEGIAVLLGHHREELLELVAEDQRSSGAAGASELIEHRDRLRAQTGRDLRVDIGHQWGHLRGDRQERVGP